MQRTLPIRRCSSCHPPKWSVVSMGTLCLDVLVTNDRADARCQSAFLLTPIDSSLDPVADISGMRMPSERVGALPGIDLHSVFTLLNSEAPTFRRCAATRLRPDGNTPPSVHFRPWKIPTARRSAESLRTAAAVTQMRDSLIEMTYQSHLMNRLRAALYSA